jgi:hypothetical protein
MKLDESKIPDGCKVKHIQKMYYGKYIYKLMFELDKSKLIQSSTKTIWNVRHRHYTNRFQLINKLLELVKPVLKNDDYRIRSEGCSISLFTSDTDDVNALILAFPKNIIMVERPVNDNHIEIMDKFRKVVVRPSLFNKNYKFKIYLRAGFDLRENRYKEVQNFLENLNSDWAVNHTLDRFFNTTLMGRHLGYTAAVYLQDTQDLMMFQLRFNNDINKIEEAILLSDL